MLLMKEQAAGPVHVVSGSPEVVDGNYDPGHQRLTLPAPAVIAQSPNCPQQQWRRHYVKQTEDSER